MSNEITVKFDPSSLYAELDRFEEASDKSLRPAVQVGAEVFYQTVRSFVPVSTKEHYFYGKSYKGSGTFYGIGGGSNRGPVKPYPPGNLRDSVYQAFSDDNSTPSDQGYKRATYHVSWNQTKAPYGFMVEFGTSKTAAKSFVRRGYEAVKDAATNKAFNEYMRLMRSLGVAK